MTNDGKIKPITPSLHELLTEHIIVCPAISVSHPH
jgi:hypothetical protein